MNLPINLRRALHRLALLAAASLAVGLLIPAYSSAQSAARSEERAQRAAERAEHAEERASSREDERATRAQEREAARRARSEAGSSASEAGGGAPSEPASSSSKPATAPPERACQLGIEAGSTRIVAGESVTLSGTLDCPRSTSAANQQIPIYERQGGLSFNSITSATTEADGSYELTTPALTANTVFQARVGNHRARVAVTVAPEITLAIASAGAQASAAGAQTRARTTFTGTVTPAVTGALVALQLAYAAAGESWHAVAYAHVAADGSYAIAHAFKIPGAASVRTIVHLGRHNAPAVSEPLTLEVPQPQNPQLSIQASVDPLISGQTLTITGVAANAAGQPVTLLAQTGGGTFTEVAKGTTEANGDYTFTQEPLQNTDYRVTDASTQSTTLLEGVTFALAPTPPPATTVSGQQLTLSGTLSPAPVGQAVDLEAEYTNCIRFHVIAAGSVEAAYQYTIAHTFDSRGTTVLRITVPGDSEHPAITGVPFTITVTG